MSLSTTFVNYGITSRIDVGVFLPVVSIAVDGSLDYTLRRGSAAGSVLSEGTNAVETRTQQLGDPVFRGKWNFIRRSWGGVALAVDGRFRSQNQLGAHGGKFQFIASGHALAVNTHVNAGVSASKCNNDEPAKLCDNLLNPFFVAGGIDKAVTKRVTLATDIQVQRVHIATLSPAQTYPTSTTPAGRTSTSPRGNLAELADTATVSVTGKINVWGNMLLTLTGLVPANSSGVTDRFTPIIGLDYAW